jgi:hypothetical protein
MLYNLQIQKLLIRADNVKSPYDRIKLLKRAVNIADTNSDIEWGFDLRKQIIEAEHRTSSSVEGLPAFTWLLDTHETHPELCSETAFMTEYKWMIRAARRNADISLEQFDAIVEDYRTRLLRNSYTLHSYYSAKAQMAFQQNRLDEAKEYLDLRESEKLDNFSCPACGQHDLVEYEFLSGNIREAVRLGADIFSGKIMCRHVPFKTVCLAVNVLDKYGYDDSADVLYKIAGTLLDRTQTVDMSNIGNIGRLVHFFTRRDKNRAWEMFERYLRWSINCEDYFNYQFSVGSLSLFKGSGTRCLNVSVQMPWYNPSGVYELPVLYGYYKNQAATLAAKFDARNGCTNFADELSDMD